MKPIADTSSPDQRRGTSWGESLVSQGHGILHPGDVSSKYFEAPKEKVDQMKWSQRYIFTWASRKHTLRIDQ